MLTLAAVLILKNNKPGIGRLNKREQKQVNDSYKGLKRYFERKYGNSVINKTAKQKGKFSDRKSQYLIFQEGNTKFEIRNADHEPAYNKNCEFEVIADLHNITKHGANAKQAYNKVLSVIEQNIINNK